jgi:hypothetical protein
VPVGTTEVGGYANFQISGGSGPAYAGIASRADGIGEKGFTVLNDNGGGGGILLSPFRLALSEDRRLYYRTFQPFTPIINFSIVISEYK